jgi:hypothetical protein
MFKIKNIFFFFDCEPNIPKYHACMTEHKENHFWKTITLHVGYSSDIVET